MMKSWTDQVGKAKKKLRELDSTNHKRNFSITSYFVKLKDETVVLSVYSRFFVEMRGCSLFQLRGTQWEYNIRSNGQSINTDLEVL